MQAGTSSNLEKGYIILMLIGVLSLGYLVFNILPGSSIMTGSITGTDTGDNIIFMGFTVESLIIFCQGLAGSFLGFLGFLEMRRINKKIDRIKPHRK